MLSFFKPRYLPINFRMRVNKINGIKPITAVIALVPACTVITADGAGPFDITVRERAPAGRRNSDHLCTFIYVSVFKALGEHGLDHFFMVLRSSPREKVITQAKVAQVLCNHTVIPVSELLRRYAFSLCLHQNRGTVLICPGDHQYIIALHAFIPCINI